MNENNYTEQIIFRTNRYQLDWIRREVHKLEAEFGEGFTFSDSDVIRRALFKEMRRVEK